MEKKHGNCYTTGAILGLYKLEGLGFSVFGVQGLVSGGQSELVDSRFLGTLRIYEDYAGIVAVPISYRHKSAPNFYATSKQDGLKRRALGRQ